MILLVFFVIFFVVIRALFVAVEFDGLVNIVNFRGVNPANEADGFLHGPFDLPEVKFHLRFGRVMNVLFIGP